MPTIGRAMMPYHSGFAGAPMTDVDNLEARLDGLPFAGPVFRSVLLIALGFGFEIYDLFLTAYVTPGLPYIVLYMLVFLFIFSPLLPVYAFA